MEINGKDIGFFYSVGAKIEFDEIMTSYGVKTMNDLDKKIGYLPMMVKLGVLLNKYYCLDNEGADSITEDEILYHTSGNILDEFMVAVMDAFAGGQEREVETEEKKGRRKNAGSAAGK